MERNIMKVRRFFQSTVIPAVLASTMVGCGVEPGEGQVDREPSAPEATTGSSTPVHGGATVDRPAVQPPLTTTGQPARSARTPSAPYMFVHARFVLARDAQGNPLGLQVEEVLPGGKVALAGVLVGDLIHSIDQIPMDDPASFEHAVRMAEDIFRQRRPQHFVVTRNGSTMGLMPLGPISVDPDPGEQP
jgi:S1-C subfamily serine protease